MVLSKDQIDSLADGFAVRHRFSVEDFDRLTALGFFHEDDRVELIRGEVIDMAAMTPRHANAVKMATRHLFDLLPDFDVHVQVPVNLPDSQPEPGIYITRPFDRLDSHPSATDVLVVIDMAETSIRPDRDVKGPLYAEAGIPEYWLTNLRENQIEVYTEPTPTGYARTTIIKANGIIESPAFPGVRIDAGVLLGVRSRRSG